MKKGISLIVLVITIIVIIILAGAIILNLTNNNPINSARIAKILQEKESLNSSMMLYVNSLMSKKLGEYSISDIIKGNADDVVSLVNLNEELEIGNKLMYLADKNAIKQNLDLDINNKTNSNWYIEPSTGKFYLVYNDTADYDSYLGEYNKNTGLLENSSISMFVFAKNVSVDLPDEENIYFGGSYTVNESTSNSTTFARIENISGTQVTISDKIIGDITGEFSKNDEIALYSGNSTILDNSGNFQIFKVSNVEGNNLTLDKVISQKFNPATTQIIKLINYNEFTISENVVVSPMPYNGSMGGVILIKSKKINIYGKIDTSALGYKVGYDSLTNGGVQASGNPSIAGGSNKYKGGNGGVNYQGYQGLSSYAIEKSNLLSKNKIYMGGGSSNNTCGGGAIYIISDELNTYSEYPISSNGKGGNNMGGGGAGGSVIINSKNINLAEQYKNYFVGANGGGGSGEILSGSTYPNYSGEDGTNVKGGNGSGGNGGAVPGNGVGSNGGGGAVNKSSGVNAATTAAGNGSRNGTSSGGSGYNAGGGGGAGGFVEIYTNSDLSSVTLTDAYISNYKSNIYQVIQDENYEYSNKDIEISASSNNVNTFSKISAITNNQVTIADKVVGDITSDFAINDEIMLYNSNTQDSNEVGIYEFYKITNILNDNLILDENISSKFKPEITQVIKVLNYNYLKVNNGVTISPKQYDGSKGGIIVIKAKKIDLYGKIDVSFLGYKVGYNSPTNGASQASGNPSIAGGSNKYKGGNGGVNYQGYQGASKPQVGNKNLKSINRIYMGGGSANNIFGGGIIYIVSDELNTYSQYPLSSNGKGGTNMGGGGAGGTILINSKNINLVEQYKNYFVSANGGGGAGEIFSGGTYPRYDGGDGTNIKGGNGGGGNGGSVPGNGVGSNGGGGAVNKSSGSNATVSAAGTGSKSASSSGGSGYNAGGGGGAGGFVAIYTNSDLSSVTLTDAYISNMY